MEFVVPLSKQIIMHNAVFPMLFCLFPPFPKKDVTRIKCSYNNNPKTNTQSFSNPNMPSQRRLT
eukprot:UN21712